MRCRFAIEEMLPDGRYTLRCTACNQPRRVSKYPPELMRRECEAIGAGTRLTQIFDRFYLRDDRKCSCKQLAAKMDRNGPDWCEANLDEIVGQLRSNAAKRGLPFVEFIARELVRHAISLARQPIVPGGS